MQNLLVFEISYYFTVSIIRK